MIFCIGKYDGPIGKLRTIQVKWCLTKKWSPFFRHDSAVLVHYRFLEDL
ncbi:hypothetical protein Patl1_19712 [Pistacia atlantica]|uniref:Uncharacterized protein n=1 Tax=Pistacia atlantica TaxID=434234 RepID=A0ACC1C3P1_9ROSI|nr:hypothetical protein Patl1_19712 [Pistacia atlantica]